jgi:hypothetical protein
MTIGELDRIYRCSSSYRVDVELVGGDSEISQVNHIDSVQGQIHDRHVRRSAGVNQLEARDTGVGLE